MTDPLCIPFSFVLGIEPHRTSFSVSLLVFTDLLISKRYRTWCAQEIEMQMNWERKCWAQSLTKLLPSPIIGQIKGRFFGLALWFKFYWSCFLKNDFVLIVVIATFEFGNKLFGDEYIETKLDKIEFHGPFAFCLQLSDLSTFKLTCLSFSTQHDFL